MPFKINIGEKGKTWKIEAEAPSLSGKSLHDSVKGSEISQELEGYEFEILGGSDKSGFPMYEKVEGIGLKKVLLTLGWGLHKRPRREGKKKRYTPAGLRMRKTVRGKTISDAITQINLKVTKNGKKSLAEIFPDQNKAPEAPQEAPKEQAQAVEATAQ